MFLQLSHFFKFIISFDTKKHINKMKYPEKICSTATCIPIHKYGHQLTPFALQFQHRSPKSTFFFYRGIIGEAFFLSGNQKIFPGASPPDPLTCSNFQYHIMLIFFHYCGESKKKIGNRSNLYRVANQRK